MTTETTQRKKKRILTNIDFAGDKAHLALTSKSNGPANGMDVALVMKNTNFSPEFIQKIQEVQVTLSLPEFLRRFFSVYYEDAEVLARFLGYVPPESSDEWNYEDYIQEKVDSFTILKSLNDTQDKSSILSKLTEQEYLAMINDQVLLEKAMASVAKAKSDELAKASARDDTSNTREVKLEGSIPEVKLTKSKEQKMTKPVEGQAPEMVAKSVVTELEKAVASSQEQLTKALATIAEFESEKKVQIEKSKTAQFAAVIKDEKVLAPIVKAALSLEQADFDALLVAVTSMVAEVQKQKEQLEKSALFTEQGATAPAAEPVKDNAVARILKQQLSK